MSLIKKLYFENYRVFKDQHEFDLKPINFLIGPNSSGKSSVFKAILLLKSNVTNDLQILDFSNTQHNLGSFQNTLHKNNSSQFLKFGFEASINDRENQSFSKLPFTSSRSLYNIIIEGEGKELTVKVFLTYKKIDKSGKLRKIEIFKEDDKTAFLSLEIGGPEEEFHKLFFNHSIISKNKVLNEIFIKDIIRNGYQLDKNNKTFTYRTGVNLRVDENRIAQYYDEPISVFSYLYKIFVSSAITLDVPKEIHSYLAGMPLRRILRDFSTLIENTEYIEAVRANTKRLYTNDSQGTSFNELILEYSSRDISSISIEFVDKWLKKFGIADKLKIDDVEGVANTVYLVKDDEEIALADLGYGITQFLPIIMKIALEQPIIRNSNFNILKKTILLEEPETNLHPKLQSLLADFIVDALNTFEIRFIIETHSEYIIRKLQILTAEKILSTNDTAIYYFNEENNNKIKLLKISENGTLSDDFGEGFYDEATELKFKLLKYKNRGN